MNKSGIYKITNTINGKCYVGSSADIDARWRKHKHLLNNNKHHSVHLQSSWNKYGKDVFEFKIIFCCLKDKHVLYRFEQYFFELYKPKYNKCLIVESTLGIKHTEEQNKKQSERQKGTTHICSEEAKKNMSEAHKGLKNPHNEDWNNKISEANKGNKNALDKHWNLSEETCKKNSERMKGHIPWNKGKKGVSEETHQKMSKAQKNVQQRLPKFLRNCEIFLP